MEKTVYADVLFLINFCLDFLSLYISARITNTKAHPGLLCFSSALGGIYSVLSVLFPVPALLHMLFPFLMCALAFWGTSFPHLLKIFIIFYGACIAFGGTMTAISNIALEYFPATHKSNGGLFFFLGTFLAIFLSCRIFHALSKSVFAKKVNVRVYFSKRYFDLELFCDSGNMLRCPYSSLYVIIVKQDALGFEFSEHESAVHKMRYIPVRTVAGSGILPAYKPEKIIIKEKSEKEICALVAIDPNNTDYFGTDGLFPQGLF